MYTFLCLPLKTTANAPWPIKSLALYSNSPTLSISAVIFSSITQSRYSVSGFQRIWRHWHFICQMMLRHLEMIIELGWETTESLKTISKHRSSHRRFSFLLLNKREKLQPILDEDFQLCRQHLQIWILTLWHFRCSKKGRKYTTNTVVIKKRLE